MTAPTEGVPGHVFGRIRAYREEHPESWRADQTAVYSPEFITAYEQWERRERACSCILPGDTSWIWREWDRSDCQVHGDRT